MLRPEASKAAAHASESDRVHQPHSLHFRPTRPAMSLPLEVLADLTLAVDGEDIEIRGDGDLLVVDVPSVRAARRLLSSGPWPQAVRKKRADQFNTALRTAGITIDVRYKNEVVARLGAGAQPNAVSRVLKFSGVEVHPVKAVRAQAKSNPIATLAVLGGTAALIAFLISRFRK